MADNVPSEGPADDDARDRTRAREAPSDFRASGPPQGTPRSSTTPLNTPPRTAPKDEQSLSEVDAGPSKKRKMTDIDDIPAITNCVAANAQRDDGKHERLSRQYLNERGRRLDVQGKLNEKDKIINTMKSKQLDRDISSAAALEVLKGELRRIQQGALAVEGENVDLRAIITHRDKTINHLELDKEELMAEKSKLRANIRELQQGFTGGTRATPREPTHVPHPDPHVHSHGNYHHPEAPRENPMYKRFTESHKYAPGTGKVWPLKYGSNANWDLGLCRVTFDSPHVCVDGGCEYRHHDLSINERTYMKLLGPNGLHFLDRSDGCLAGKPARSI